MEKKKERRSCHVASDPRALDRDSEVAACHLQTAPAVLQLDRLLRCSVFYAMQTSKLPAREPSKPLPPIPSAPRPASHPVRRLPLTQPQPPPLPHYPALLLRE